MIRTHMVKSLYKNLLGPKDPHEVIGQPYKNYHVGVLISCYNDKNYESHESLNFDPYEKSRNERSRHSSDRDHEDQSQDNPDDWPDTELSIDGSFTLGLSFVVSGKSPKIRICSTWGRYKRIDEKSETYQRMPNYYLTGLLDATQDGKIELHGGNGNVITTPGIELRIRSSKVPHQKWALQVFLVNRTNYDTVDYSDKPKRQNDIHRVFQPQIRILIEEGSLEPLDESNVDATNQSGMLYHEKRTKARGFQCGAVWDEVDPERNGKEGFGEFSWPDKDSGVVPANVVEMFIHPHVRTEYLPAYAILQPRISERQYSAERLSNEWDPEELRKQLSPITDNYRKWITKEKKKLEKLEPVPDAGKTNLNECEKSLDEVLMGINFICSDERARLAFCFMNSVMAEKMKNETQPILEWREFQMAFILQSLRGVAGTDKTMRDLMDVLWFPTGGGKTEAYLGIVVFTIAYRRLLRESECLAEDGAVMRNDGGVNVISRYTLRLLTMQQFQRALGAIVESDIRRVENWVPSTLSGSDAVRDKRLTEKIRSGKVWGESRFSMGLWIGGDATPTKFCQTTGLGGKLIPNAEGELRSSVERNSRVSGSSKGDPAKITNCPVCNSILCFPKNKSNSSSKRNATWIVKTRKTIKELESIDKKTFYSRASEIQVIEGPSFSGMKSADGFLFVRITLKIRIPKNVDSVRDKVDRWWDTVKHNFASSGDPLMSTRAGMPGYFFLRTPGRSQPYDFVIHCTNKDCKLNKMSWYENLLPSSTCNPTIPEPFTDKDDKRRSTSVPISAYTVDEQIYFKCPTFIIATVDKFANLPWEPKCASIFGNIDCQHRYFGLGRESCYQYPLLDRNKQMQTVKSDLFPVDRFLPPSLIIQDELHLIDGPLGSMMGVYEMAVDALTCASSFSPKYIASSATINEAKSQIGTIFRRHARIFPARGISASDSFFANTDDDQSCIKNQAGRLYMGICSGKSVFELPIKICGILMGEIHKIKEDPAKFGLQDDEVEAAIDPYWTYVSYFNDLQLMSKFVGFYGDDIKRDVKQFSPIRVGNGNLSGVMRLPSGSYIFPIAPERDISLRGISVYCRGRPSGLITVSLYDGSGPSSKLLWESSQERCSDGENTFDTTDLNQDLSGRGTVWIGVHIDTDMLFEATDKSGEQREIVQNSESGMTAFPDSLGETRMGKGNSIRIDLLGKERSMNDENMIDLSSRTKSEDLTKHLDRLQNDGLKVDALFTSPVFGTGIDVDRLGIMQMMTQPKTTSGYIQATGRVGRKNPGLVITWLNSRRARDLDHYENFVGYHRQIHRYVEPITANPFSEESLKLCLGPIIVSILRNGRQIHGTKIPPGWVQSTGKPNEISGPRKILEGRNVQSAEITSIKEFLCKMASKDVIPKFRKNERFDHEFDVQIGKWLHLIEEYKSEGVTYGDRNSTKRNEKIVVLGSPYHKRRGSGVAFGNTPNSLRYTESTSAFSHNGDVITVRPTQFLTRYGSGAMLPFNVPAACRPVDSMISDLRNNTESFSRDMDGKSELQKIVIQDPKMVRMLKRFNPKMKSGQNIKIFELPTNDSLNSQTGRPIEEYDKIYGADLFPQWATCSQHRGERLLGKITRELGRLAVMCPSCNDQYSSVYSSTFSSSRFVMACRNGHMYDVDWNYFVHDGKPCSNSGDEDNRIFVWDESDGGDNIEFRCHGIWQGGHSQHRFVRTTCNASTTLSAIRYKLAQGLYRCKNVYVEGQHYQTNSECDAVPQISRKSMMSLRSSIVLSTLAISKISSSSFNKFKPHAPLILGERDALDSCGKWESNDLAQELKKRQRAHGMDDQLITDIEQMPKAELLSLCDELQNVNPQNNENLTEWGELKEELYSLKNGTEPSSIQEESGRRLEKFPITWSSKKMGFRFQAMPFDNIRVTMVQTGYSREITTTIEEKRSDEGHDMIQQRRGKIVSKFSRHHDAKTGLYWYPGTQNSGEGIFIRFDPNDQNRINKLETSYGTQWKKWSDFHRLISEHADEKMKSRNDEQQMDELESMTMKSHPNFVWWHTLAHQIILELSIDSGFAITSLKERIYSIRNEHGISSGILIFASAPGSDGTLGGLTSLVDEDRLPSIVEKAIGRMSNCSNDPVCTERKFNKKRYRGAVCHACVMTPETSCSHQNKFLDRNLVRETFGR